jgi:ATP-dependent Clp protease ATP-binding subunit ClpB
MTSNIGSEAWSAGRGAKSEEDIRQFVLNTLRSTFRPEFLNRVDEVIIFRPLSREQIGQIVEIQLGHLRKLLADRKLSLELTPQAHGQLAEQGYDPVYGARPLKRVIQQRLQNPLALKLLQGEFKEGDTVCVGVNGAGEFTFGKT